MRICTDIKLTGIFLSHKNVIVILFGCEVNYSVPFFVLLIIDGLILVFHLFDLSLSLYFAYVSNKIIEMTWNLSIDHQPLNVISHYFTRLQRLFARCI